MVVSPFFLDSRLNRGGCKKMQARSSDSQSNSPYQYTAHLLALDGYRPIGPPDHSSSEISTPLNITAWEQALADHPDKLFAQYLIQSLKNGFRVGFGHTNHYYKPAKKNLLSAQANPQAVDDYFVKDVMEGRVVEITNETSMPSLQISPFGVILKKSSPGNWRLIVDLSSPGQHSVNGGIPKGLCSLSYCSVDDAVRQVLRLGNGAKLAKLDVKNAFRLLPVHPADQPLLDMCWNGRIFVDKILPFGLRSAPKLFNAVADALQWVMEQRGVSFVIHYLDDFLTSGAPDSNECEHNFQAMLQIFKELGVPFALAKCEGPATVLTFLGIEIDTVKHELRLPAEKLRRLQETIAAWRGRKRCSKQELLSLIGQLQHASTVVKPGRVFLCRMISLASTLKGLDHHCRLNHAFRSDLEWWHKFLAGWNNVSIFWEVDKLNPDLTLLSDASGQWGCGALLGAQWFQYQWPEGVDKANITRKELIPIALAAAIWGHQWSRKTIVAQCGNLAVVEVLNRGYSREPGIMHLVRCLFFFSAHFHFRVITKHIPGKQNILADALSLDRLSLFHSLHPQANSSPAIIPAPLITLLITSKPDWLSQDWTNLFADTLKVL